MNILDHGYVRLVEAWGSDQSIIEAARMSTDKGFLGWGPRCEHCGGEVSPALMRLALDNAMKCASCGTVEAKPGDEKLLKYLYENKHATPFEFAGLVVEVQAPIFVFREWHRHRTQSYNEMSARYAPLPDLNYIPSVERLMMNAGTSNKQAGTVAEARVLTRESAEAYRTILASAYALDEDVYQRALSMGVPKELARIHLPVGRYSKMRASTCLRNWLGFLTLRQAENAQWEIRQYADAVGQLIQKAFPRTWELYRLEQVAKAPWSKKASS